MVLSTKIISFLSREFKEYSYVSEATKVVKAMWINQGNEERLQKIFMKEIREVLKKKFDIELSESSHN